MSQGSSKVIQEIQRWQESQRYGSITVHFRGGVITHMGVSYTKLVEGFEKLGRDVRLDPQVENLE